MVVRSGCWCPGSGLVELGGTAGPLSAVMSFIDAETNTLRGRTNSSPERPPVPSLRPHLASGTADWKRRSASWASACSAARSGHSNTHQALPRALGVLFRLGLLGLPVRISQTPRKVLPSGLPPDLLNQITGGTGPRRQCCRRSQCMLNFGENQNGK